MKFFKKIMVSIDFSTQISINSLALGSPPRTPYKRIFRNFLNYCPNFRQKCDKILKHLKKSRNFLENLKKW